MKQKLPILLISALALYGSVYLAVNKGSTKGDNFLAEVVNLSATVPPTIVAIEDEPEVTNSNGGGGSFPATYSKPTVKKTPTPDKATDNIETPDTELTNTEILPVVPVIKEDLVKIVVVAPVKETTKIVIDNDKKYLFDDKTLEPYVEPDIVEHYLDPFLPKIVRTEVTDDGYSDTVLKNIVSLNIDKVSENEEINLYANKPIIFTGKTVPFAKLEITMFSRVQKDVIFADQNGDWFWSPPKPIEVGEHVFNVIIKTQGTDELISTKKIPFIVRHQDKKITKENPLSLSLTPGYQPVPNQKPFNLDINFYRYDENVKYPIKIEYKIFNIDGALYGEGFANADPKEGTIVRLPIDLQPGTKAGIYRIRVTSEVMGEEVYADAVFKVMGNDESKIVEDDRIITEEKNNILVLKIFILILLMGSGVYYILIRKK